MANNALQNLIGNRDAIRKLMSMDKKMDIIAESARNNGSLSVEGDDITYNKGSNNTNHPSQEPQTVVNEQVIANHPKMPKAVLESFKKNPGKTASLSILGNVPEGIFEDKKPQEVKKVQENYTPVQTPTNIDYSLIKTIINEAVQESVKKYISALSKKLINESTTRVNENNLACMKIGNSFSFIDESGNIYKANLEFVKNIND